MMLIVALVLVLLAMGLFIIQSFRENFASMVPPGLALFAGGVAAWLIDILHAMGKL